MRFVIYVLGKIRVVRGIVAGYRASGADPKVTSASCSSIPGYVVATVEIEHDEGVMFTSSDDITANQPKD